MYPGSFIWNSISDEWLESHLASILFAVSAAAIALMTVVGLEYIHVSEAGLFQNLFLGIGGALGALGVFFLWGGMWRYWLRCDTSGRTVRKLTFVLLSAGLWYGAIVYYLLVYLRGVRRQTNRSTAKEAL